MIRLEKINGKNVWDFLKLKVDESQKNFVASNEVSIIEAYTAITGNGYAFPFGIYDDTLPETLFIHCHVAKLKNAGCHMNRKMK